MTYMVSVSSRKTFNICSAHRIYREIYPLILNNVLFTDGATSTHRGISNNIVQYTPPRGEANAATMSSDFRSLFLYTIHLVLVLLPEYSF